jgi:hypothetical protein
MPQISGRPFRALFDTVAPAEQIVLEALVADRVAIEKSAVVQSFADKHMGKAEHQRDIGARCDRQPLCVARRENRLSAG